MELQELFKLLLRKKLYFVFIPILSGAIAFALRYTSPKTYVSEAQMSTGLTIAGDIMGDKGKLSPFEIGISFGNIRENMSSKLVVNRLSYKLLLRDLTAERPFRMPLFEEGDISRPRGDTLNVVREELKSAIVNYQLINKTTEVGDYIYALLAKYRYGEMKLLDNVKIYRVGNTDFINIRFGSEVPKLSEYVSNLWVDNFIEYSKYQKKSYLNESLNVLSDIMVEKQKILDESIQKLNRYRTRFAIRSGGGESDPVAEYERLIRDKESNLASLNIRLQSLRDKIADADKSSSFKSRQQIIRLKNDIDRLSARQIQDLDNQQLADSIEMLRNELQSQMYLHSSVDNKNDLDRLFEQENELKIQYQIELSDLQQLRNQYRSERGMAQNLAASQSILENLETEVDQARQELTEAQDKYNEASNQLLAGSGNFKVSYYGDIPEDAQSRKTALFGGVGAIAGFVIVLFMVLALEILDTRLKNIYKFERTIKITPAGLLPFIKGVGQDFNRIIEGNFKVKDQNSLELMLQTIKKLRFRILSEENSQVILFTSFRPQTGKSFLITALANSLSLIDKKVLIIDTNFRNANLTKWLHTDSLDKKVETLLPAKTDEEDVTKVNLIFHTINTKVDMVRGKYLEKSPDEVFANVEFQKLLGHFRTKYDYILLEGSALNSYSDSIELTRYTDKIVCVYSANDQFSIADKESLEFLQGLESKFFLNILNKLRPDDAKGR